MKTFTKSEEEMMKSCFTYGYGMYNDYIKPIIKNKGIRAIKRFFRDLDNGYTVLYSTYTDSEGCSYNTLIKK